MFLPPKTFVKHGTATFVRLALGMGFLMPVAWAQKPPSPTPPPAPPPNRPATNPGPAIFQPSESRENLVMFLQGRVATSDGTSMPNDVLVERVCNARVRQQVHATSGGNFSMQLGSKFDSMLDASGSGSPRDGDLNKNSEMGIPRRELANCELRASIAGFSSSAINLVDLNGFSSVDVGTIVVERREKIEGLTLSAAAYRAPKDAISAYEKGVEAARKGKLPDAQKYFGRAVEIYPTYTNAWFQLGRVLRKDQQKDAARAAFTQAATLDSRFLPPFVSLASMAYEAKNWLEVLQYTNHVLDGDPLGHVAGDVLDLDSSDYTDAYFYNSAANYNLKRFVEAEKSGLKAARLDLVSRVPQVHLLLAEIFARKKSYGMAIVELRTYLELVPHAKNAEQTRERLAKLEKLKASVPADEQQVEN
jgi:tetratricopeptide (TPR) repeat protein